MTGPTTLGAVRSFGGGTVALFVAVVFFLGIPFGGFFGIVLGVVCLIASFGAFAQSFQEYRAAVKAGLE